MFATVLALALSTPATFPVAAPVCTPAGCSTVGFARPVVAAPVFAPRPVFGTQFGVGGCGTVGVGVSRPVFGRPVFAAPVRRFGVFRGVGY